jgi:outer membrane protein assembly factor BamB
MPRGRASHASTIRASPCAPRARLRCGAGRRACPRRRCRRPIRRRRTTRSTGNSSSTSADPPPPDNALDWQFVLDEPTNVTPALWVAGATENIATDRMFAYGGVGGNEYFGAADNLYCQSGTTNCPDVAWFQPLDSKIDGSAIAITPDGASVYGVTSKGTVYGFNAANGATATGFPVSVGAAVSWASPWLDFQAQPYPLYVADTGGKVTRIDTSTGSKPWSLKVCASPIHSSPIVWNGVVWVGCDDGHLYRITASTGKVDGLSINLCLTASKCDKINDAIYSAPFVDSINDRLLIGVNRQVWAFDISPTSGCTTGGTCTPQASTVGSSATFYSSPFVDVAGGFVYIAFNNKLWRAPYDGTQTNPILFPGFTASTHALGAGPSLGYPKSSPMVFDGHVWLGDGGGFVNRFSSSTFAFEAVTPRYGSTIDTTPLIDVPGGNIYYGTNGVMSNNKLDASGGSWVQLAQDWTYP